MTEIFRGVFYECRRLPDTAESSGLVHLIKIDLSTPGLELYVTPKHPEAVAAGWEYETRWMPFAAKEAGTSILVNGDLFMTANWPHCIPGDWARSIETMISDGEVNHVWEHSYLLWFTEDLTPKMEFKKPPPPEALAQAKWAVSGQGVPIMNGKPSGWITQHGHTGPDRMNFVGIDAKKRLLFIGIFDNITAYEGSRILSEFGAIDGTHIDGGTSTGLVIGDGAKGVRSGTYVYPLRGIPTFFGVRAPKL